jgi:hypothetical protein
MAETQIRIGVNEWCVEYPSRVTKADKTNIDWIRHADILRVA